MDTSEVHWCQEPFWTFPITGSECGDATIIDTGWSQGHPIGIRLCHLGGRNSGSAGRPSNLIQIAGDHVSKNPL